MHAYQTPREQNQSRARLFCRDVLQYTESRSMDLGKLRYLAASFLGLTAAAAAAADSAVLVPPEPFSYTVSVSAGVQAGTVSEYVYYPDGTVMSRLDWQEKPSYYAELAGSVCVYGVYAGVSASASLPVYCGIMEDYDWLYTKDLTAPTNYSRHDMRVNRRFDFTGLLGYRFDFGDITIAPLAGLRCISQKWTASGGYFQYGANGLPLTGGEAKTPVSGDCISYEQLVLLPAAGFQIECVPSRSVVLGLFMYLYPYVYADALDLHLMRDTQFYDEMRGGNGFAAGISAGYRFAKNRAHVSDISLTLRYDYYKTGGGESFSSSIGQPLAASAGIYPGTESSCLSVSAVLRFR